MRTMSFVFRLILRFIFRVYKRLNVYRSTGLFLPAGSEIADVKFVKIGKGFSISEGCKLMCQDPDYGSKLIIGDDVKLNYGVLIISDNGGDISIGNNVLIGPYVVIRASNHSFTDKNRPIMDQGHIPDRVLIEDNVWIGAGAIILPGSIIRKGTVIGAGAVVRNEIQEYSVAGGVPARILKQR